METCRAGVWLLDYFLSVRFVGDLPTLLNGLSGAKVADLVVRRAEALKVPLVAGGTLCLDRLATMLSHSQPTGYQTWWGFVSYLGYMEPAGHKV